MVGTCKINKTKYSDETFNFSFESIPSCSYTFDTEIQMKRKTQWYLLYKTSLRAETGARARPRGAGRTRPSLTPLLLPPLLLY